VAENASAAVDHPHPRARATRATSPAAGAAEMPGPSRPEGTADRPRRTATPPTAYATATAKARPHPRRRPAETIPSHSWRCGAVHRQRLAFVFVQSAPCDLQDASNATTPGETQETHNADPQPPPPEELRHLCRQPWHGTAGQGRCIPSALLAGPEGNVQPDPRHPALKEPVSLTGAGCARRSAAVVTSGWRFGYHPWRQRRRPRHAAWQWCFPCPRGHDRHTSW
jgi:hypothetical protein